MEDNKNIVIGIEGYVGSGKTSICKNLLTKIPNSIILHGGNLYRAIVCSIMKLGIDLNSLHSSMKNMDIKQLMDQLNIEIKMENSESVFYIQGKKIEEEEIQSKDSSMAVSIVGNVANNAKLYSFGKNIIEKYKEKYNVIVSGRDLVNIYPELDYHFLLTASLEERINRKYTQYKGNVSKEEIEENIKKRDELQEKTGYYIIHSNTIQVDVTDCKTIEEATNKVFEYIK